MSKTYRPDLPQPMPSRIAKLPEHRGFPVPWFVQWLDNKPEFRIADRKKIQLCIDKGKCWVCGRTIYDTHATFVIGPMCAINRVSSEPPAHHECAVWSARACPFLARPHATRRVNGIEDIAGGQNVPGVMIQRNPGVALVWRTRRPVTMSGATGLFDIGEPDGISWWCEGREATREEVEASIDTGLPLLYATCDEDDDPHESKLEIDRRHHRALDLLPA